MTQVEIATTSHNFKTTLAFTAQADGSIGMRIDSQCPFLSSLVKDKTYGLDPMVELFKTDASELSRLADQLPHRACPFLFSALKGLQVEAKLEKPSDYTIQVKLLD